MTRGPGEGLWRPGEIALPPPVEDALRGVVRIRSRELRFRISLFETEEASRSAARVPHARDKQFVSGGGVVWPTFISRAGQRELCAKPSAALSPGIYEICRAAASAHCTADPCVVLSEPLASAATGVAVSRLADGSITILTAYHVAREAIERQGRTSGQTTLAPVLTDELSVDVSSDPRQGPASYRPSRSVYLVANGSKEDWHEGRDWALLAIPADEARGLVPVRLAAVSPKGGDPLWIFGFPFRTQRPTGAVLGYADAAGDLRISHGLAVDPADLGPHPPFILTNADIASGNSGGPVVNAHGEVVAIVHNSLCKPDGEIDLGVEKFCGLTEATSVDAVGAGLVAWP
jgi:hypothetical protein